MIRCLLEPYKTDQPFSDKEKKPKPTRKKPSQDPKKPPPLPSSYKVGPLLFPPFQKKPLKTVSISPSGILHLGIWLSLLTPPKKYAKSSLPL